MPYYNKYKLNIVISGSIPCLEEIIGLSLNRPNTSLHFKLDSLYELLCSSSFAIGSGGNFIYERIAVGVPSISMPFLDVQVPFLKSLAQYHATYLTSIDYLSSSLDFMEANLQSARHLVLQARQQLRCHGSGAEIISSLMSSRVI